MRINQPIQSSGVTVTPPKTPVKSDTPKVDTPKSSSRVLSTPKKSSGSHLTVPEQSSSVRSKSKSKSSKSIKSSSESMPTDTDIAKKIRKGQHRRQMEKLATKQEDLREKIDGYGDLIEDTTGMVDDFLKELESESGGKIEKAIVGLTGMDEESLTQGIKDVKSAKEDVAQVGTMISGLKTVVSLKHMITNPHDSHARIDLLTSGLDLSGDLADDENMKAVSSLVKAAQEIYKKQQAGKMDTGVALEQLSKVGEQLGKALEQTVKGESLSANMLMSGMSFVSDYIPDLSSYLPDVTSYLPDVSSGLSYMSSYVPESVTSSLSYMSGVSEWVPGLATLPAAYQLYNDVQDYRGGKENSGTKVVLSSVKLVGSYWGGVGKAVGLGSDLVRWGMGLSGDD